MSDGAGLRFLKELRRRRVFRVAGLYVVGVWLVMQVADIVFPAWGIPDAAIRYLLLAAMLGFPVAMVFGWIFQLTPAGIRRTRPEWSESELQESMPLSRRDYLILLAFVLVIGWIGYDAVERTAQTTAVEEWRQSTTRFAENSVAVLPFTSLSGDPEHEYFADGISEEILNRLSDFDELKVIARTSSFSFKDSGYDIAQISALLGVKYLLQGSVRRDGQQLRIAAQLVDQSGVQVWSNSFDRQLGAVFALQSEIAEAVAVSIVPQISPPSAEERLPDLEAYLEYLIGREILLRRPSQWFRDAPEHFTRAIETDPEYAEPYAARAIGRVFGAIWAEDQAEELEAAQRDIDTALALQPELALGLAAQALLDQKRNPAAHRERELLLRRALELDPNLVDAWNWLAGALTAQGREQESEEAMRRGARIDPLAPAINMNLAMRDARRGRTGDAERRLTRLLEIPQPSSSVAVTLCRLQLDLGRVIDSLACTMRRVLADSPREGRAIGTHALMLSYASLGMLKEAEYWLARGKREWPEFYQGHMWGAEALGLVTGHLDYQRAIAEIEGVCNSFGIECDMLGPSSTGPYGALLALSGNADGAKSVLEPLMDPDRVDQGGLAVIARTTDIQHALAWAWMQSGEMEKADRLLGRLDHRFGDMQSGGRLHLSDELFDFARNSVLLGERERALELLAQAAEAGWRGYYGILPDPRWDAVRDDARFQAVLATVKADLDAQRAEVEATDANEDFIARLDAAIALHAP